MSAEQLINLTSLVIAAVSLIVSLIALRISQRVVVYTSREYIPDLEWELGDDNSLHVVNKSKKLFTILQVACLKIEIVGFEISDTARFVQAPFIVYSRMRNDWVGASKIVMDEDNAFACAYVCPYDPELVEAFRENIPVIPSEGSNITYLPSLQSVCYLVEIVYSNRFRETKTLYLKKHHVHGSGYHKTHITAEEFSDRLKRSDIPKFEDVDGLWTYAMENFQYDL